MSHVVQEVYLSCSAGKNGQGVRHSSTRSRKPNSSLDQEVVAMERIRELRKRRGGVLSALTANKRKEIDSLLTDENNLEAVKVKLTEITSLFQRFTDAHEEYNAALIDESQRQESVVYFTDIESSLNFFCQTVNDWLRVTEIRIQDLDVTPDDSVSQLGLRNRKRSGCGSAYSRSSRASSISVARAKEAARIAELQAEVHALKQRQLIHETELRLKKEELDLQFKKDQLKLETEFKKAVARESAYAKADSERNMRVASSSFMSRVPRVDPRLVAISDGFSGDFKQESSPVFHGANFRPKKHKTKHKVPSQSSSDSDEQSGLSDQAFHILEQQNRVMEEFVYQQQKNTLPRRKGPIFDGNPLSYCTFMRAFEYVIESNESDSGGRLYYLEQHRSGRAREILRSCMYLNPEEGYSKAR